MGGNTIATPAKFALRTKTIPAASPVSQDALHGRGTKYSLGSVRSKPRMCSGSPKPPESSRKSVVEFPAVSCRSLTVYLSHLLCRKLPFCVPEILGGRRDFGRAKHLLSRSRGPPGGSAGASPSRSRFLVSGSARFAWHLCLLTS